MLPKALTPMFQKIVERTTSLFKYAKYNNRSVRYAKEFLGYYSKYIGARPQ